MFDLNSRYATLPTREHRTADGRRVVYVTRRFVPPREAYLVGGGVTVTDSDRIDLVSHRAFGSPVAFWQIADANGDLHPAGLTAIAGRRLVIPIPRAQDGSR